MWWWWVCGAVGSCTQLRLLCGGCVDPAYLVPKERMGVVFSGHVLRKSGHR